MNEKLSTLESLSNELFIQIFRYFNTPDLFQSFYNLNFRCNSLIQTFNHLHLTISENNHLTDVSPYIRSLTIIGNIDIDLQHFKNLRRLIIHGATNKLLKQFDVNMPYLQHFSIPDILFGMSPIYQKIFSNAFPVLKSCELFGFETIETILPWAQTTSLRVLTIGLIDFHVYKAILVACPNLHYLKLTMFQSYLKLSPIQEHYKLKQLEIHSEINDWRYNDQLIDIFLGCVPNLEQLSIYRSISVSQILDLIPNYDWLASIIAIRLSFLRHFSFCLHLEYHLGFVEFIGTETRRQLRKFFFNAHSNRYQSRFILK